jgi:transcriptional regulator with XRE-family HTH domain
MGQGKLGKAVGLTFQQIQKYERGSNRIGSSRLYQFSKVLQVPVSFFFDDMPEEVTGRSRGLRKPGQVAFDEGNFTKRETLELVRGYYKITDVPTRRRMFELVKAIGAAHSK